MRKNGEKAYCSQFQEKETGKSLLIAAGRKNQHLHTKKKKKKKAHNQTNTPGEAPTKTQKKKTTAKHNREQ